MTTMTSNYAALTSYHMTNFIFKTAFNITPNWYEMMLIDVVTWWRAQWSTIIHRDNIL